MELNWKQILFGRRKRLNSLNTEPVAGISSVSEMRKILLSERARADRNGHEFSIIILDIDHDHYDQKQIDNLFQVLKCRLRSIDEIGWLSENQISIVLMYTIGENATKVAADITGLIDESIIQLKKILTYPSRWPYKKNQD